MNNLPSKILIGAVIVSLLSPVAIAEDAAPFDTPQVSANNINALLLPAVPVAKTKSLGPVLSARSVLAMDLDSGIILYQKNMFERLPIASLTKLMTVLTVLDIVPDRNQTVKISKEVTAIPAAKMYLAPGDELSIRQLILGALIHSSNDAAYTLSLVDPDFIQKMNQKAVSLGLEDTHFSNAIGWDEAENYSSAYDLSKIMRLAINQSIIYEAIGTQKMDIISKRNKTYHLQTTNQLFGSFLDEVGGKTGTTDEAGPSFINIFRTPNKHRVMTILLNSQSRFQETKLLSWWVLQNFEWK